MRSHLNIQVCVYPFFDGGFYVTFVAAMLMFRVSIGFIDLRVWYDRRPGAVALTHVSAVPPSKPQPQPPMMYPVCRYDGADKIKVAESSDGSLQIFESEEAAEAAAQVMGDDWGYTKVLWIPAISPAALSTEQSEPCIGAQQKKDFQS